MKIPSQILSCLIILVFFSCDKYKVESESTLIFDIKHYCELTEQGISNIARQIELEGRRPKSFEGFKKLDSCLILRKQLFQINDDSLIISAFSKQQYIKYLKYLCQLDENNQKLKSLCDENFLNNLPPQIDLIFISNLARFEYTVIENNLIKISPIYCGYGNRVFAMQETKSFIKDGSHEVLLISDFSTSRTRNYGLNFFIDSVMVNNKKLDVIEDNKTIDRIGYLKLKTPQKGKYWIYGYTKLDSDSTRFDLAIDKYPFSTIVEIE